MRGSNEEEGEMEGGIGGNLLDPCAVEFYPASQFPAQIYYPYLPPPPALAYHPHVQMQRALPEEDDPTRTVVLSMLPRHLDEASVAVAMEAFGAVKSVESAALSSEGTAAVHFYDIRSAVAAVYEIREQHIRSQGQLGRQYGVVPANWGMVEWPPVLDLMSTASGGGRGLFAGQAVWAQFGARCVDGTNQGSLFVFNCDPTVPSAFFFQLFSSVGNVKEVKESAWKPHMRIIEFYDTRDAARAAAHFNGKEVCGRRLLVKFTCAAGHSRRRSAGPHRSMAQPPRFLRSPPPAEQTEGQFSSLSASSSARGAGRREEWVASDSGKKVAKSSNATNTSSVGGLREEKRGKARQHQPEATTSAGPASSSSSSSSPTVAAAKQQLLSRRGWKNHSRNGGDSRFQFKEMAVEGSSSTCKDSRTTVMIKNIPNKYSQKLLLRMLDNHCIRCNEEIREREVDDDDDDEAAVTAAGAAEPFSAYDFVYLPIDFNNKCNVGYGFVNLTSPEAAMRLHRAFHMQPWEVFNSRKICQVNYARLQGLEALKEHFKNSKFACDTDEYMPVVFSPPRDGKELTEPVPVGGRGCVGLARLGLHLCRATDTDGYPKLQPSDAGGASSTTASTHAPSDTGVDDDHDDDDVNNEDASGDGGGSGGDETVSRLSQALQLSYSSQG